MKTISTLYQVRRAMVGYIEVAFNILQASENTWYDVSVIEW